MKANYAELPGHSWKQESLLFVEIATKSGLVPRKPVCGQLETKA